MRRYWNKFLNWLIPKRRQRLLTEIMKRDQELGLYDEPFKNQREMNNIIDYLILTHNHVELPSLVKRFLRDGWELYGTPFVDGPVICQPVIKRLKNE